MHYSKGNESIYLCNRDTVFSDYFYSILVEIYSFSTNDFFLIDRTNIMNNSTTRLNLLYYSER